MVYIQFLLLVWSNPVIVSSSFHGDENIFPAMQADALSYLLKYSESLYEPHLYNDTDAHSDHIAQTVHHHRVNHALRLFVSRPIG
jgi:hypothetical protein